MDLEIAIAKITESIIMNELDDIYILDKSLFNKNWLNLSKKEIHFERGFIFKTRRVYSKHQFKILELVKKSTINMNSDLNDSMGYYLKTNYQLFARLADGNKMKISSSNSGDNMELLAQKIGEIMECKVYHISNIRCQ